MSELASTDLDLGYVLNLDRWVALRQDAGLTPTTLGAAVNRSSFSITLSESGKTDPPCGVLCAVARTLGVRPMELLRPATAADVQVSELPMITPRPRRRTAKR
jgi:hypothetical protein